MKNVFDKQSMLPFVNVPCHVKTKQTRHSNDIKLKWWNAFIGIQNLYTFSTHVLNFKQENPKPLRKFYFEMWLAQLTLFSARKTARYLLSAGRMSTNGWTSEFDMGIRLIVIYNEIHCGIHKPLFRSEVPEWLNGKWIIWNIQFIFVINIIHLSVTLPKILFSF